MLRGEPGDDVLPDCVAAAGDGGDVDAVLGRVVRRIAGEFAERPFRLSLAGRNDALDDDFCVGRYLQIDGLALNGLQRLAIETADNIVLVGVYGPLPHATAKVEQRVGAIDDGDLQSFAAILRGLGELPKMSAAVQTGGEGARPLYEASVKGAVANARFRVFRDDDACGDVRAGVLGKMSQDR